MNKRVLIVDNDAEFLETRAERLEAQEYDVERATSLEQAEDILKHKWIHVVIIDLRLRDDADDKDTSGLALAKQEAFRSIPKIILTRYPTFEAVREALSMDITALPPAVDFIAKQDGPDAMLRAVERAFAKHIHINKDITIQWAEAFSFQHLTSLIEPGLENAHLSNRTSELEDLFRKLFSQYKQITIGRLFLHRAGQVILEVFAYDAGGTEGQFVVSCGQRQRIEQENAGYEMYVPKWDPTGGVDRVNIEHTLRFAATVYRLVGCDLEEIVTFREHYRRRSDEAIATSLDHLFQTRLAPWYRRGRFQEEKRTLRDLYLDWLQLSKAALSQADLERQVEALCRATLATGLMHLDYSPHKLTLHLDDGESVSYHNPAGLLSEVQIVSGGLILCGITHGGVDADTVLVDAEGHTWLIDFTRTGRGPLLRDFVLLEATIKLDMLEGSNLEARLMLEQRLLDAPGPDEVTADNLSDELRKALSAVIRIRTMAAKLAGYNRESYLAGLFFCVIQWIVSYQKDRHYARRELVPYAHSLLVAAMLYEQLIGTDDATKHVLTEANSYLWFDRQREEIWVEGRQTHLTPQEFKFFKVLYDHAGELCTRDTIMREALGRVYTLSEESLFNSTISRLRQEIEPNPKRPQYILNTRGRGYRLDKHKIYMREQAPEVSA